MIESIEAVIGRHQAETASRDGREEAMDASKFRKLLGALSKGRSAADTAQGALQDLMSALVVEPLPVTKMPKQEKKSEAPEVAAPSEDEPVHKTGKPRDEDASQETDTSPHLNNVEAKVVEPPKPAVEEKPVTDNGTQVSNAPDASPACTMQPVDPELNTSDISQQEPIPADNPADITLSTGAEVAEAGDTSDTNPAPVTQATVSAITVNPVTVNPDNISKKAANPVEESGDEVGFEEDRNLTALPQTIVQSEISPEQVVRLPGKELPQDTSYKDAKSRTETFTSEPAVPVQQIETTVPSREPVAPGTSKETKSDQTLIPDVQNAGNGPSTETTNDLPVVEGLLQLRALIERVSHATKGIGAAVAGKQAELAHSLEGTQDSNLSGLSAAKENPASKAAPNVVGEKSNKGLNTSREKAVAIPERMIPNMMEKLEQVAREVERSKDGRSISLRLDPPQLGKVRVDMTMKDGSIHTRLTAESELVAQFLRERGDELQALIRKALPNLDQATLSFGEGSTGNQFGQQMNFGGDSFNGFLDNRGSGGDLGSRSAGPSDDSGRIKEHRRRSDLNGGGEHWVA